MRITALDIPKDAIEDNGLDRIVMRRLGPVVVLAGPNGSGKTRLLRKIREICRLYPKPRDVEALADELERVRAAVAKFDTPADVQHLQRLDRVVGPTKWTQFSAAGTPIGKCFDWVPKSVDLVDCNKLTRDALVRWAQVCESPGLGAIHKAALARIQHVQNVRQEVTHPDYQGQDKQRAIASYTRLRDLVERVLGTPLERDSDGNALVFGRTPAKAGLSDGQKVLLQFCAGLHAQGKTLDGMILLMDEPENHLHPSAIIEVIDRVRACLGDGQIWIATHSVPLIAQFDPDSIWYMDEGRVTHAGQTPEKVLNGLLGGEERAHNLAAFVDLPASFAASRFAAQCLMPPGTVPLRDGDPQMAQVKTVLGENGGRRILDFGAGQGRLASSLAEVVKSPDGESGAPWDYVAYDHDKKDREACQAAISRLCGTADGRWFSDLHAILDAKGAGFFDCVVMCNVLHEIDPADWLDLFSGDEPLVRLMRETASLLIVEDYLMPVGEKAYAKGFLVLDTDEIHTLFGIPTQEEGFHTYDERNDGRLKAHRVPRAYLPRITADSRRQVLDHLRRRAKAKVRELRNAEPNFVNGRLHAFWTQQLANTTLALDELGP